MTEYNNIKWINIKNETNVHDFCPEKYKHYLLRGYKIDDTTDNILYPLYLFFKLKNPAEFFNHMSFIDINQNQKISFTVDKKHQDIITKEIRFIKEKGNFIYNIIDIALESSTEDELLDIFKNAISSVNSFIKKGLILKSGYDINREVKNSTEINNFNISNKEYDNLRKYHHILFSNEISKNKFNDIYKNDISKYSNDFLNNSLPVLHKASNNLEIKVMDELLKRGLKPNIHHINPENITIYMDYIGENCLEYIIKNKNIDVNSLYFKYEIYGNGKLKKTDKPDNGFLVIKMNLLDLAVLRRNIHICELLQNEGLSLSPKVIKLKDYLMQKNKSKGIFLEKMILNLSLNQNSISLEHKKRL